MQKGNEIFQGLTRPVIYQHAPSVIAFKDQTLLLNLFANSGPNYLSFLLRSLSMQTTFLDMYMKLVLNAKERPPQALGKAFHPLFTHMEHEDFKTILVPSCIKMLKRNPEIVLESIGSLFRSVNLDLSKYAVEFFPVVLSQARHADEDRRAKALSIIGFLSQKSSDPDTLPLMFDAIKAIIGGTIYSLLL